MQPKRPQAQKAMRTLLMHFPSRIRHALQHPEGPTRYHASAVPRIRLSVKIGLIIDYKSTKNELVMPRMAKASVIDAHRLYYT